MNYQEIINNHYSLVEASAGTGKTYTIEQLFLLLIKQGVKVNELVVITFTNKSTSELKHRLRAKLQSNKEDTLCQEALLNWSQNSISTIHSFCHSVLNDLPFETRGLVASSYGSFDYTDVVNAFIAEELFQKYKEESQWLELSSQKSLSDFHKNIIIILERCHSSDVFELDIDSGCTEKLHHLWSSLKIVITLL